MRLLFRALSNDSVEADRVPWQRQQSHGRYFRC